MLLPPPFSICEIVWKGKTIKATFWISEYLIEWCVIPMNEVDSWTLVDDNPFD